jgi:beta-lactam-binding protein with PASTA domain
VIAPSSTSILPPPAEPVPPVTRRPAGPVPVSEDVYRRRRVAVIAGLALAALAVIALLVLLSGDDGGGGTVAVPAVVGRTEAEATRILTDAGLRVRVTQRDAAGATDQVSDQDPDAGKVVNRDSTVTIFVARPAPTTTGPSTTRATTATTSAPTTQGTTGTTTATTAPATTQATTATTQAPATTAAPTTQAPTTSIVIPTILTTTTR